MLSYVFMCLISFSFSYAQDPVINLPQGRVVGIKVYTENSPTPVEIFFGIPYANPPIGRLRFSPPERHPGWRRTLFAHKMPPRCPEPGEDTNNISEDCLYLNIWTSRRVDNKLQPVVVILYSDSWARAGINLQCQDLAAENLVVVTVAYRLNIFGFFTLKSEMARGNLALLDQYMALLWVKENIAAFGGDSTSVTVIGHTAGADSVLYHIFSPRSIGLFHRAIIMSPQDTTLWKSVNSNNNDEVISMESLSRTLSDFLGCRNKTDHEILLCMKSLPIQGFAELYSNLNWTNALYPTIDNFLPQTDQYLPISLSAALADSNSPTIQLDVLLGTTDLEAIYSHNNDRFGAVNQSTSRLYEYASNAVIPELLKILSLYHSDAFPTTAAELRYDVESFYNIAKFPSPIGAIDCTHIRIASPGGDNTELYWNRKDVFFYKLSIYNRSCKTKMRQQLTTSPMDSLTEVGCGPPAYWGLVCAVHNLLQATMWEYFGFSSRRNERNVLKAIETIARMETSVIWGAGCALLAARLARKISRLYVYRFSEPFTVDLNGKPITFTGAVHGTDLLAFLGDPLMLQIARRRSTQKEKEMSIIFRQYLTNFIKYGSPGSDNEWPRYIVGDSNIHNVRRKESNITDRHDINKELAFWLQYLPRLSQTLMVSLGTTEKITSAKDDSRLRGGVFAMCGVSAVLVLLLFISVILIHRRNRRPFYEDTQTHL